MQNQAGDLCGYITGRLADAWKVDAEWKSEIRGGFRWWAHRLEQRITVDERPVTVGDDVDATEYILRAETAVLANVPDQDAAVRLLAEVNQRSGTFALCYEPAQRAIVAVSAATMVGWHEPIYRWFSYAAILQVCAAEDWAGALAAELGAEVAVSGHPEGGRRTEPDEMLDWIDYSRSRPEWVLGSYELIPLIEPLAATLEAGLELTRGEGADELRAWPSGFSFPLNNPWHDGNPFRATVASAIWHPDLGPGARFQITAPFDFGKSAAELVNLLNSGPTRSQAALLGAWWAKEGKVGLTGFLPQALTGPLLGKEDSQDEQRDIVDVFLRLGVLGQKIWFCEILEENEIAHDDADPPTALSGYSGFLDRLLLGEKRGIVASVAQTVPAWSPDEYRAEPVSSPDLGRVDPDIQLAVFGTFNPAGPTLNVIGALLLADGRYLLANWMRHPFSPDYSGLLILPDLEPATVWDALVEVLHFCAVGTAATDFAGVYAPEALEAAVADAFMRAAENRGELEEISAKARVLEDHRGNPWASVSGGSRRALPYPEDPAEVVTRWWSAVTNDQNFFGYVRSFPEAWDGAIRFLKSFS
jgi:hypothetical protein